MVSVVGRAVCGRRCRFGSRICRFDCPGRGAFIRNVPKRLFGSGCLAFCSHGCSLLLTMCKNRRPYAERIDGRDMIIPVEKYGVKLLSIGFFVDPDQATLWRGGMASNALKQLIADAAWGELDYFLIDLPPGTSDIHLTVVQTLAMTGAIVVSTPQAVALADARKGINMFTNDKVNVPILGLVENMAWFTPAELPENKYYIFGKEGAKKLAEEMNVPLLGQIPIVQSICEGGDNGTPVALDEDSVTGRAFLSLAASVVRQVDRRNVEMAPTQIVEMHK